MLRAPPAQHPARDRPGPGPDALDVGRADHGERDAGDALGQHDVVLVRLDDGALVVGVSVAFGGGDEPRAELDPRVAHAERRHESRLVPDPARAHERRAQVAELIDERFRAVRASVPAGAIVHRDESPHAGVEGLQRPLSLGDVVIHDAARRADALHNPFGFAQGGDEEPNSRFDRDVHPALHAIEVEPGRPLDQDVHADGLVGEPADQADPLTEIVPVHVDHREGLDDPDAARMRNGGHELRVGARVHGTADQRHVDPCIPREGGVQGPRACARGQCAWGQCAWGQGGGPTNPGRKPGVR